MKKLLLRLAMQCAIAAAMENPAALQPVSEKKRKKRDESTEQFRLDLTTQLRDYKRNGLNPYRTSLPLWDPITNHETITAYVMNKEIGHVSFSDNTAGDTRYNLLTPKQGTIHSLYIDPHFRMQRFGYDLFRQAVLFLKARGVSEIVLIKHMDLEANENWRVEQKQADKILYNMLCRLANNYRFPSYNYETQSAFYKDESSKKDTHIERYYKITFVNRIPASKTETTATQKRLPFSKFQSNPDIAPIMESSIPAAHIKEVAPATTSIAIPVPAPAQHADNTIDFLKEYITEEKKSGEKIIGSEELEYTQPVADDLYDNSFEIDIRTKSKNIVGQVTYGQESGAKNEGAIHYFYLSPEFEQNLGYSLFQKAIQELLKMGYKKINWHASLQKDMKRETLHNNMKQFAEKTKKEFGLRSLIENDHKNNWIKMYLYAPAAEQKEQL